jgi:predicted porin
MNKKVIALAVAGALASPLAAQAQTANVTMYGTFRVALESTDLKDVGRNNHVDSWSSRWGIRGIESLGGGLNGIFQLELGINIDNPGGAVVDFAGSSVRYQVVTIRESWVGLNGGFGTIKMGAGLTPYDDVLGMDHLLLANGFEGLTTLGGGIRNNIIRSGNFTNYAAAGPVSVSNTSGAACLNSTDWDARYGESFRYDSPNFAGLTFATQFAFLGENSTGFKCKGWDSAVIYNNGPIEAALAYARHIDFQFYDGYAWRAHAAYSFPFMQILGAYERMHYDGNNGTNGDGTARYYSVGVVVPVGPGRLTAQYHNRNKSVAVGATQVGVTAAGAAINTPANVIQEIANGGGKAYSVTYKYGFSKRTYVFAFGAQVRADSEARIEGGPFNGRATAFGFGVQHNF